MHGKWGSGDMFLEKYFLGRDLEPACLLGCPERLQRLVGSFFSRRQSMDAPSCPFVRHPPPKRVDWIYQIMDGEGRYFSKNLEIILGPYFFDRNEIDCRLWLSYLAPDCIQLRHHFIAIFS
jgi:hypothetical protein